MKTDYRILGQNSLQQFKATTARASQVQRQVLLDLMRDNSDTEIGRRLGFDRVSSPEEYQRMVPLSRYDDYVDAIGRSIRGERGILTREPPVYFCISSGSTDRPKYLPLVTRDIMTHYTYAYGAVFGMIEDYYGWPDEPLFSSIFQVGEFVKTWMPDGTMSGIRSSSLYQWLDRDGEFDASAYCVPKEVLFPTTLEDLTYVRVRFALAERHIQTVFGVFVHRLVGMLSYMEQNWDMLLHDMRLGTVSPEAGISDSWVSFLNERLPPDPGRAEELGRLDRTHLREGMLKKLWPEVRSMTAIGGGVFLPYMQQLSTYSQDIPIYPFAYAASEGIFAIAPGVGRMDEYVLLPDSGFFEFIPEHSDSSDSVVLTIDQVKKGERYELVFTNHSGLYRYRMEDVVEVIGFYGESPMIRFCYRKNQVVNVADERTNLKQFEAAVHRYCDRTGVPFTDNHCLFADFNVRPPRYCVCLEEDEHHPANAGEIFDECLCQENFGYRGCRNMGEVGCVHVVRVPRERFGHYEDSLLKSGKQLSQIKPLRIIMTDEGKQIFEDVVRSVEK